MASYERRITRHSTGKEEKGIRLPVELVGREVLYPNQSKQTSPLSL